MRAFVVASLFVALLALPVVPALAQGCGLPASGTIVTASATYTLTADCTMTDTLAFGTQDLNASKITITINGGGHAIIGTIARCGEGSKAIIHVGVNVVFNLNNATIKNGGRRGSAAISLHDTKHSATFRNVTFLNTGCSALWFDNSSTATAVTHTLSSLLFEGNTGNLYSADHGHPAGIQTIGPVSLNINNIALRGIFSGNAAIGANDTYSPSLPATKGRITFSGCLTVDGVFPRVYYGDIVDNSRGPCSGAIGNGGSSAIKYPQAPVSACGLPLGGFIYGKHTFNLRGDCAMNSLLRIPYESDVTIKGNSHSLVGAVLLLAGPTRLRNMVMSGSTNYPILTYLDQKITISNVIFRGNARPLVFQDSIVTLADSLIENHQQSRSDLPSGIFVNLSARLTIRDSVFRGNSGGVGLLYAGAPYQYGENPATTLEGCITFESNSPRDIYDPNSLVTDSRTRPCPPNKVFLRQPSVPTTDSDGCNPHNCPPPQPQICERQGEIEALPLGDIACVFRYSKAGETVAHVYEIEPVTSRGFHKLTLRQSQAAALEGEQIVAVSADGRALAVVWPDDNITIKAGPNYQGKIAHITFAGGLGGGVIDFRTTYGPAPGLPYINLALPHRIQPGGAAQPVAESAAPRDCMVTTQYILNLRDAPGGDIKGIVPAFATLTVTARAEGWHEVDYHGERGWLSADYVRPTADCG